MPGVPPPSPSGDLATRVVSRGDWRPPGGRRLRSVRDRLREIYGIPRATPHRRPVDELVLTVLSQSTNDRNRDVAHLRLRRRFDSWEGVRDAPPAEVEEAIRPGGISRVKSARIQAILRALPEPVSLDDLAALPVPVARERLCALPGVGRKTAACVLLFAFGMRDVPVDTHVSRVATRLGLLRPGAPFDELHDDLLAMTPRGQELELHVNLLRHGRRTCHARRPACGQCALRRMCPSADAGPARPDRPDRSGRRASPGVPEAASPTGDSA